MGLLWDGFRSLSIVGMSTATEVKEVVMDVGGGREVAPMEGGDGGAKTRRRRRAGRRTRAADQMGGASDVSVEKAQDGVVTAPVAAPAPVVQAGGAAKPKSALKPAAPVAPAPAAPTVAHSTLPKVVIAPPKKRAAKLLFVPKSKVSAPSRVAAAKTFKARRVSVTIDNTAKTQKRRKQTLQRVEGMTEDELRGAAVAAKLSRRETVAKVPAELLRQMLKDYYMMRGMLV